MASPEENHIAAVSPPDSSSPAVQESPFFHYVSNLSPIKSVKTVNYAQRFLMNSLPTPSPVFASPQIDIKREIIFQRRNNNDFQGSNVCETQVDFVPSSRFDKEAELCSSSGSVDEYLHDPIDVDDCAGSSALCLQPDNEALKLFPRGFSCAKESKSKTDGATEDNMESGTEAIAVEDKASMPNSHKLVSIMIDCDREDDERLKGLDDFINQKANDLLESPMNLNRVAQDNQLSQVPIDHQCGIRRHLQFNATDACENTSKFCGKICSDLRHDSSRLAFLKNVTQGLMTSHSETPTITGKWPASILEDFIDCGSSLSPFGTIKSTQNLDNSTTPVVVPCGIGLHLNSIASGLCMSSGKRLVTTLHTIEGKRQIVSNISPAKDENTHTSRDGAENICLMGINAQQEYQLGLEVTQNERNVLDLQNHDTMQLEPNDMSHEKRRKKTASTSQNKNYNHCNCKMSKCLKLYCECFADGIYCLDSCACENCYNKPIFEAMVFDVRQHIEIRNPLAFAPKVVKPVSDSLAIILEEGNKTTPSSARHKRGCNCKKSKCLKKYCECYQEKVGCSDRCRCVACQNSFGIKTGETYAKTDADFRPENNAVREGRSVNRLAPRKVLAEITNIDPSSCNWSGTVADIAPASLTPWLQKCRTGHGHGQSCEDNDKKPEMVRTGSSRFGLITGRKMVLEAMPPFPSLTPYKNLDGGFNEKEEEEESGDDGGSSFR